MKWLWLTGLLCWGCAQRTALEGPMAERARWATQVAERGGDLRLFCDPEDAEVAVDGVPMGTCKDYAGAPRGLLLGRGLHRVDVSRQGYVPYVTYCEPDGTRASLAVRLAPAQR